MLIVFSLQGSAPVAALQSSVQLTDVVQAATTIVLALLTAVYVVLTHRMAKATRAQVHERLYDQNQAILQVLVTYPLVRPYIYDSKPLDGTESEELKSRIGFVSEMFAGFIEQVALQAADDGLPESTKKQWLSFVWDIYSTSPAMRDYLHKHGGWYSKALGRHLPDGALDAQ